MIWLFSVIFSSILLHSQWDLAYRRTWLASVPYQKCIIVLHFCIYSSILILQWDLACSRTWLVSVRYLFIFYIHSGTPYVAGLGLLVLYIHLLYYIYSGILYVAGLGLLVPYQLYSCWEEPQAISYSDTLLTGWLIVL